MAASWSAAVGQTPDPAGEFWPQVAGQVQLRRGFRVVGFTGLEEGTDFSYEQFFVGAGLGFQFKQITRLHLTNIDPDKEHYLVVGAGYEYLTTTQSGSTKDENRAVLQVTPRYRPPAGFLLDDRNRVEFRWVNGAYSTRYRNRLTVERDFLVQGFRFTPYVSAEAFYDWAYDSWNEAWYAAGIQFPYRRLLRLDVYYLRQNCTTCSPQHVNVAGLSLNLFLLNNR